MLKKTVHTVLKVGPRTNIICKKIFEHSLNYCTGQLQTLHLPQGTLLNFFSLERANSVIMTQQQEENVTKWLHTIHLSEKESFLCNRLKRKSPTTGYLSQFHCFFCFFFNATIRYL